MLELNAGRLDPFRVVDNNTASGAWFCFTPAADPKLDVTVLAAAQPEN